MNIRNVLRTYGLLRQLTDDESALLTTLRGMSDSERDLLVESLAPAKAKAKRKAGTKSRRASALGEQIATNLQQREPQPADESSDVQAASTTS